MREAACEANKEYILRTIAMLTGKGKSGAEIARHINKLGLRTRMGKKLTAKAVMNYRYLNRDRLARIERDNLLPDAVADRVSAEVPVNNGSDAVDSGDAVFRFVESRYGRDTNDQIARELNRRGLTTPRGYKFTAKSISDYVYKKQIKALETSLPEVRVLPSRPEVRCPEPTQKQLLPKWFHAFLEEDKIPSELKISVIRHLGLGR